MVTRKINVDELIKKGAKEVSKSVEVSDKKTNAQIKSFEEKVKVASTPFLYRIKDVWKAFAALMAGFYYWFYHCKAHDTFRNCDADSICFS